MSFRRGRTVHTDGCYSVLERVEGSTRESAVVAGYSLTGPAVDAFRKYDSLEEALHELDRLSGSEPHALINRLSWARGRFFIN